MGNNLPDDVTNSDIDDNFGGKEQTFYLEAMISASVPDNGESDSELSEKLEQRIERVISLKDYNILSQETKIQDRGNGKIHGSVVIDFPFTTINTQDYQDFALKELRNNLDDSDEDIQFLEFL